MRRDSYYSLFTGYILSFLPGLNFGFPTRCDTNRAVQPKRMARALKLIFDSGTSYVAKTSGADQLHAVTASSSLFSHNAKSGDSDQYALHLPSEDLDQPVR